MVEQYEKRIDEIRDGMECLNVEELKEHVLNAHIPSRSRPSSAASIASVPPPLSYVQLSDFTAVVTATILRALPYLSRLASLLTTWDVRLLVARQIPGLLRELRSLRALLAASFDALKTPQPSDENPTFIPALDLDNEKLRLESGVVAVGRRMDRVLDALEGRQDSLPEAWIDDLDKTESDFATWVVEAERYKIRAQWFNAKDKLKEAELPQHEQEDVRPDIQEEVAPTAPDFHINSTIEPIEEEPEAEVEVEDLPSTTDKLSQANPITPAVEISQAEADTPIAVTTSFTSVQEPAEIQTEIELEAAKTDAEEPQVTAQEPQVTSKSSTSDEVEGSEPAGHDSLISTDSDSIFPEASDPDTSLSPRDRETMAAELQASEYAKEDPKSPLSTLAENIQTPTQQRFPRELSVNTPASPTPSRIPLPVTPKVANKENIRPRDISPQFTPKRLGLIESIEKDPFTQTPPTKPEPQKANILDTSAMQEMESDVNGIVQSKQALEATKDERGNVEVCERTGKAQPVAKDRTSSFPGKHDVPIASQPSQKTSSNSLRTSPRIAITDIPPAKMASHDSAAYMTPTEQQAKRAESFERKAPQSESPQLVSQSTIETESEKPRLSKAKPLQSPIKLSKNRPARLSLDKKSPKSRNRRPSTGSVNSLLSDNSSLASGPDDIAPLTGSSSEAYPSAQAHPEFTQPDYTSSRDNHVLREDRLRRLENRKAPTRAILQDNRSVSLPLERFINEKMDLDLNPNQVPDVPRLRSSAKGPVAAKGSRPLSSTPTPQAPFIAKRRPALSRGKSSSNLRDSDSVSVASNYDVNRPTFGQNTARRALHHTEQPKSVRLQKRLTAHRSLESLGLRKQELDHVEEDESELLDGGSRTSSPSKSQRPRDQLDEKINSILSTLPGRIHLVDPANEADTSSSSSSMDRKMRERYLSESPRGLQSRSVTPAPSLTLMPAARRRLSHAHKTEDSYVKLYHLHHGGQTAPTKLFVRTVGEDGQRVMVRVGGGWADLGEYLREYVIHHGRRKVSETPLVEVQGLVPRPSPGYSSPATLYTPTPSSHISGRATPSRPPSALSARPPSSLTVRKTRRGSNASDAVAPRSVTTGTIHNHTSPPTAPTTRRRLSVSSSYSFGDPHTPGHPGPGSHETRSTPLGLAGPKPRSRHVSMSPEGEAWVENVLQKTRRSTSLNPPPFALNVSPGQEDVEDHEHHDPDYDHDHDPSDHQQSSSNRRSTSDIGTAGTSRRVVLRGLGSHR